MKIAIITPYHDGTIVDLPRACAAVDRQTYPVIHVLVGDGVQAEIGPAPRRVHVALPRATRDSGGTPRAAGGEIARSLGCDVVCYLDADDGLDPNFAAYVARMVRATGADIVSVPQALRGPNLAAIDPSFSSHQERVHWVSEVASTWKGPTDGKAFLSQAGLVLGPRAQAYDRLWTRIPQALSRLHDIFFSWALLSAGLSVAWLPRPAYHYRVSDTAWFSRAGLAPEGLTEVPPEKAAQVQTAIRTFRRLEQSPRAFDHLCGELGIDMSCVPEAGPLRHRLRRSYPDAVLIRSGEGTFSTIPASDLAGPAARPTRMAS